MLLARATKSNSVDPTYLDVVAKSPHGRRRTAFEARPALMEKTTSPGSVSRSSTMRTAGCHRQRGDESTATRTPADAGEPRSFFCNDAKEIVASWPYSPATFQMKDVARPRCTTSLVQASTWASVPLFDQVHVWLLGASGAASEVAALADHVGFAVTVVDYDPAYVSEARFPTAKRIVLEGGNFDALEQLDAAPEDYVCVLTRGHMFDPEGCVWATRHHVHYVGMMGCAGKNDRVRELVLASGATEEDWERVKRPIGLKFGAKTPAELAIAIVAELVDVRYRQRYSAEARERHEKSLGR